MINLEERDSRLFRNIDCENLATRTERIANLKIGSLGMHYENEFVVVQERRSFGSHNLCSPNFFKLHLVSHVVGAT
jgi:hypothetical protein